MLKATTPPPCLPSIPLVPVRYAVVPRTKEDTQAYTYQHNNLESDFPSMGMSKYTLRKLRTGFIYIHDDAGYVHLWRADGNGNFTEMKKQSLEDYRERDIKKMAQNHISVPLKTSDGHAIKTIDIAFCQSLMTKSTVDNIKKDPAFRARLMQTLNLEDLEQEDAPPTQQKHVLPLSLAKELVEEYKPQPMDFSWSAYSETVKSVPPGMTVANKPRQPALMALYDAQGIVLDLGSIVNHYQHQFTDISNRVAQFKENPQHPSLKNLPGPMFLDTRELKTGSVEFLRKKVIADLIESMLLLNYPEKATLRNPEEPEKPSQLEQHTALAKETLKYEYGVGNPRNISDNEAHFYAISNPETNPDAKFIIDHIDKRKLRQFQDEWAQEMQYMDSLVDDVMAVKQDRVIWLKGGEEQYKTNPKSLAAVWSWYDRYHASSAWDLELAISTAFAGIGIPVPEKADSDPEWKLLDHWINEHSSPLYMAIAAYQPFQDALSKKLDSTADILGGLGSMGEELHSIFPATFGTSVIIQNIQSYTFKKLHGQTRWNRSHSILKNVRDSLANTNLKKLLQAIEVRYRLISETIEEMEISKQIRIFTGPINIDKTELEIDGTRNTTVKKTTTIAKNTPIIKADLLRSIGASGVSSGVAFLHSLNLLGAIEQLQNDGNVSNRLNLGSALFGALGAFSEVTVKGWELQNRVKTGVLTVGAEANSKLISFLAGKAWQRSVGYLGAIFEASTQFSKTWYSTNKGHILARNWYFASGVTLGAGGGMITLALTSNVVPVLGWVMCVGILAVAGGIYAANAAEEASKHVLMKRWLAACDFGIEPEANTELQTVLSDFYLARFTPEQRGSDWDDKIVGNNILNLPRYGDHVTFDILLPGYVEGVSRYEHNVRDYDEDNIGTEADAANATILEKGYAGIHTTTTKEGLMLHIKKIVHTDADSIRLEIRYSPNPIMTGENKIITQAFFLDD